ncbi:MAG: hypothetical protein HC898_08550 [Phycisphaerales bacterium]|nr:hypothetical protein [Phycisphaerales bacterium]
MAHKAPAQGVVIFDNRVSELRRLIEDIRSEIADLRQQLMDVEDKSNQLRRQQLAARSKVTDARDALGKSKSEARDAGSQLTALRTQMDQPRRELHALRQELIQANREDASFRSAQETLDLAQEELRQAEAGVMSVLETRPDYREAQLAFLDAREQLQAIRDQGNHTPMQLAEAHAELLRRESVLNRIVQEALASNPVYQAAQASVASALKNLH